MTFHGVRVYRTTTQALGNATETLVQFTAHEYDTDGFHDDSTDNSRLTVPVGLAGYYHIFGAFSIANNATGQRTAYPRLNGSTTLMVAGGESVTSGASNSHFGFSTVRPLDEGDYIEVLIYQNSGGSLNLDVGSNPGNYAPSFGMEWRGPL